jgi:putative holliday junction resolvase
LATPEQAAAVTVLAFDYGLRRIGVAAGNSLLDSAKPLAALKARDGVPDWNLVRLLLDEWKPQLLLVGLPLNMDGTPSEMSARAERFGRRLHGRFGIACTMVDERLSSVEARERMEAAPRMASVDSVAACVIFEAWLQRVSQKHARHSV